ncbi:uncharacterized protein DEA37_0009849, partial [Paragonimus westermani]
EDVHLKLLVPGVAAGAIIGRGGEAVEAIKRTTGARLKMSKANDFYPGFATFNRLSIIHRDIRYNRASLLDYRDIEGLHAVE